MMLTSEFAKEDFRALMRCDYSIEFEPDMSGIFHQAKLVRLQTLNPDHHYLLDI